MKLEITKTDNATRNEIQFAFNAGWINQKELNALRGDYSEIRGDVVDFFRNAELKVHAHEVFKRPDEKIAIAIAKHLDCNKYDVYEVEVNGGKFTAKVDNHGEVSGAIEVKQDSYNSIYHVEVLFN